MGVKMSLGTRKLREVLMADIFFSILEQEFAGTLLGFDDYVSECNWSVFPIRP